MKKTKLLTSIMAFVLAISLGACNSETDENVDAEGEEELGNTESGLNSETTTFTDDDIILNILKTASSISLDSILSSWSGLHAVVKEENSSDDAYLAFKGSNLYGYWYSIDNENNIITTQYILDGIEYTYTLDSLTSEKTYSCRSELYTYITILEYHNRLDFTKPYYFARNLINDESPLNELEYTLEKGNSAYSLSISNESETYTYITDIEYTLTEFGCSSDNGITSYSLTSISLEEVEEKMSGFDESLFLE